MSDYYCNTCDKILKRKNEKHFNSKYHNFRNSAIVYRYSVKNVNRAEVETTLRKYIASHPNKFVQFRVNVKWKVNNISVKCEVSDKINHGHV